MFNNVRIVALVALAASIQVAQPGLRRAQAPQTSWAYRTPRKAAPPRLPGVSNTIDAFLLSKLRSRSLGFAPIADRRTLIRRAAYSLTGLPPSPAEVAAFTNDRSPNAWAKVIDRLLASPRYGERWARHWLDVVRYGETDGGEHNRERPNSWPYRDYVIDAFNSDTPYNQFVREQIAGDILSPNDPSKIAATGFLVAGPWDQVSAELNQDPVMKKTARMDELDDMVNTTCSTFLALTVNCARCHDHKFDPIPAKDYYRLTSVFSGAGFGERSVASPSETSKYEEIAGPLREAVGKIRAELDDIEDPVTARLLAPKYRAAEASRALKMQRISLNPLYNRDVWPERTARYWRFVVTGHKGAKARLASVELLPARHTASNWTAPEGASSGKPVILTIDLGAATPVSEAVWSTDPQTGRTDGTPNLYRVEFSEDGKAWTQVASNLDHISRLEEDLPQCADAEIESALSPELRTRRSALRTQRELLDKRLAAVPIPRRLYACRPQPKPERAFLLERGSVQKPKEEITPGSLTVVSQLSSMFRLSADSTDAERRLALAEWMVSPKNPLTARVIVNRVWYIHFGAGIVNTPSDFGLNGDRASHPELLDRLAVSFMEHGWSLKWLHREIMSTRAYLQSDSINPKAHKVDAANRLLWHMPLRRMDAETLRDSLDFGLYLDLFTES